MKKISSGKVRDIYEVDDQSLMIVVSDRISAFDVIMHDPIPDKGKILNQLSSFWFDLVKDLVPNHILSTQLSDFPAEFQTQEFAGRSMWVKKLKMLPVECIVRGYITGSGWADYQQSGKVCGIALPKGLQESEKLSQPLFTPSSKAELGDHDENISFEKVCELLGSELAHKVREKTIAVYEKCAAYALTKGIIIADTKFEFGLDENGELVLGDEVLTPDSSRFWSLEKYEVGKGQDSYDKQFLRDWLKANGYQGAAPEQLPAQIIEITRNKYLEALKQLTGQELEA
ncbi:MAG: phosphoribosylaminoimidazolesuccinocarboxamide synthase [Lachnospiraceae bacterium]|jgi:phosphoribosylaminoimidazole-succinocarboxamide synthase|nr:phosphoribosylaminoimidazolesuccinocarboxamide synthase [Lachnospiraceae bacterium]